MRRKSVVEASGIRTRHGQLWFSVLRFAFRELAISLVDPELDVVALIVVLYCWAVARKVGRRYVFILSTLANMPSHVVSPCIRIAQSQPQCQQDNTVAHVRAFSMAIKEE